MSAPFTIPYQWTGDSFVPANAYWQKKCDEKYVIGQRYTLEEVHERSSNFHRAYFAAVREGFANLPSEWAKQFPNSDALRRHCLIKAGFCESQSTLYDTQDDAMRTVAFMQPVDEYSILTAIDGVVTRYTARSQSYRNMDKREFEDSSRAVLDLIAGYIGTTRDALEANAETAL